MQRMQHSSLVRFCDECGLANDLEASHCAACQHPLASASSTVSTPPVAPIAIAPSPVLEVTPGALFATGNQSAPAIFWPGMILAGRYEIREEIGRGGFSIVYRAVELGPSRREVAIKRIQLNSLSPRQVIDATETFNREITMLARFNGVNGVPAFYEHLTDAENWYLISQYIPGQTLEDYLQNAPGGYLKEDEALGLGIGLAGILQHLHGIDPPVIFRDLKPANIMLTPDHNFFLIDFGIARNFTPGKAKDTTRLGSPGYAPPEQYGRAQTDQRSDIYSLGATLQTMLTGRDPLDLRAGEPSLNPKAPSPALRKLLDAMLSPDPNHRPSSMLQLKKRLEAIPSQRAPGVSYLIGLAVGTLLSLYLLMFVFFNSGQFSWSWGFWPIYMISMFSRGIWQRTKKKYGLSKISRRFLVAGLLTVVVPTLLIWFLYVYGWRV